MVALADWRVGLAFMTALTATPSNCRATRLKLSLATAPRLKLTVSDAARVTINRTLPLASRTQADAVGLAAIVHLPDDAGAENWAAP